MQTVVLVATHAALILAVIIAHELGHFIAGLLGGQSASGMRIRLLRLPPHVALADGGDWIGPRDAARYATVMQQRFSGTSLFRFVSGGLVFQTAFAVAGLFLLRLAGQSGLGWMLLSYSGAMVLFYLGFDPMMTWITGHQTGDVTALFAISPLRAIVTLLLIVAAHAFLLVAYF